MTTCSHFCRDLAAKSEQMYVECLDAGKEVEEAGRAVSPSLEFEEISSIPK